MDKYSEILKNIPNDMTHIKIDIGLSYTAPNSNVWISNESNLFVIGFEPNPEAIECITDPIKNAEKNKRFFPEFPSEYIGSRFLLIPFALSNIDEPSTMNFYATELDIGTSSLHKPSDNHGAILGNYKTIDVPVYSLKHFFDIFPFERFEYIDYIKIDAQGSDLDILKGAGDYLKEKVVYITAEPEHQQYINTQHNTSENIEQYLISQNFIRVFNKNTSDPTFLNMKYQHLADSIFISQI
jgi:FkbM family methyltransferase